MTVQASRFSASGRECPSSATKVARAAHASPCMCSRVERDLGVCVCAKREGGRRVRCGARWRDGALCAVTRGCVRGASREHGATVCRRRAGPASAACGDSMCARAAHQRRVPPRSPWPVVPAWCGIGLRCCVLSAVCACWGRLVLGQVSGLEAFSREPPCDSVGALAARQAPETRGTAWAFLSYCPILPSRRRRDPFQSRSFSHKRGDRAKRVPPGPAQDDRLPREAVRVLAISS
ncbi:hypothetical protein ERJ75_000069000 [Trypanosoma vivax]|nr:hypothetical protein ERJ75_000555900 [Trypanosoma vivax]KAH8620382.1 hypothetical protein ERJ75_000069000 [Trypanosoma vivax]